MAIYSILYFTTCHTIPSELIKSDKYPPAYLYPNNSPTSYFSTKELIPKQKGK